MICFQKVSLYKALIYRLKIFLIPGYLTINNAIKLYYPIQFSVTFKTMLDNVSTDVSFYEY